MAQIHNERERVSKDERKNIVIKQRIITGYSHEDSISPHIKLKKSRSSGIVSIQSSWSDNSNTMMKIQRPEVTKTTQRFLCPEELSKLTKSRAH